MMFFIFLCALTYLFYAVTYYYIVRKDMYIEYRKKIDENYPNQQIVLSYHDFINYYRINKSNWTLNYDYGLIFYQPKNKNKLAIVFNQKDYFKVNRWISDTIVKNETNFDTKKRENLAVFLNSIQKDIDEAREESRKEKEKASETFMMTYKNLIKDDQKARELDAIINASKTDC